MAAAAAMDREVQEEKLRDVTEDDAMDSTLEKNYIKGFGKANAGSCPALGNVVKSLQEGSEIWLVEGLGERRSGAAASLCHAAHAVGIAADDLWSAGHGHDSASRRIGAAAGLRVQFPMLAMTVQLDTFVKEKKMVDTMMVEWKERHRVFRTSGKTIFDNNELKEDSGTEFEQLGALAWKGRGGLPWGSLQDFNQIDANGVQVSLKGNNDLPVFSKPEILQQRAQEADLLPRR